MRRRRCQREAGLPETAIPVHREEGPSRRTSAHNPGEADTALPRARPRTGSTACCRPPLSLGPRPGRHRPLSGRRECGRGSTVRLGTGSQVLVTHWTVPAAGGPAPGHPTPLVCTLSSCRRRSQTSPCVRPALATTAGAETTRPSAVEREVWTRPQTISFTLHGMVSTATGVSHQPSR